MLSLRGYCCSSPCFDHGWNNGLVWKRTLGSEVGRVVSASDRAGRATSHRPSGRPWASFRSSTRSMTSWSVSHVTMRFLVILVAPFRKQHMHNVSH